MKNKLLHILMVTAAGLAISLAAIPASGQEKQVSGKGEASKKQPAAKAGTLNRLRDGTPDIRGNWNVRANAALFDIQDHPVSREGIRAGKGVIVDPPDGKIPYQPWALDKAKDLGLNHMIEESDLHCYMAGIPHQMYSQMGMQIRQTPGNVLFLWEYMHSYRNVPLDGRPHIPANIKLFMGDSVGHWEGDTLVIDVTNQNGRTWFDIAANFHSDAIHVVERITAVDANTLNYEATIEDPQVYTRPWKVAFSYGRDTQAGPNYELMEFSCWEGEDDIRKYTLDQGGNHTKVR